VIEPVHASVPDALTVASEVVPTTVRAFVPSVVVPMQTLPSASMTNGLGSLEVSLTRRQCPVPPLLMVSPTAVPEVLNVTAPEVVVEPTIRTLPSTLSLAPAESAPIPTFPSLSMA